MEEYPHCGHRLGGNKRPKTAAGNVCRYGGARPVLAA